MEEGTSLAPLFALPPSSHRAVLEWIEQAGGRRFLRVWQEPRLPAEDFGAATRPAQDHREVSIKTGTARDDEEVGIEAGSAQDYLEVGGKTGTVQCDAEGGITTGTAQDYEEVGIVSGTAQGYEEVGIKTGAAQSDAEVGIKTGSEHDYLKVGVKPGTAIGCEEVGIEMVSAQYVAEAGIGTGTAQDYGGDVGPAGLLATPSIVAPSPRSPLRFRVASTSWDDEEEEDEECAAAALPLVPGGMVASWGSLPRPPEVTSSQIATFDDASVDARPAADKQAPGDDGLKEAARQADEKQAPGDDGLKEAARQAEKGKAPGADGLKEDERQAEEKAPGGDSLQEAARQAVEDEKARETEVTPRDVASPGLDEAEDEGRQRQMLADLDGIQATLDEWLRHLPPEARRAMRGSWGQLRKKALTGQLHA